MRRHARRGLSALRLELLETRTLLSIDVASSFPAAPASPSPAASLLVRFDPSATAAAVQADLSAAGVHLVQSFADGTLLVAADPQVDVAAAVQQLGREPRVIVAELNDTVQAQGLLPNNPNFKLQWGLNNSANTDIDAPKAWTRSTGSSSIIVAVLDTGIDLANPAFAGRIWTNPDSSGSDGYAGDVHGWNFVANDANVQDDNDHGTHVAGVIAASANNGIGVVGVDWNAQIMPLKVLDANGEGSDGAMVGAINYAVQHGARVINASWGGGPYSQAVADAISYAGSQGVVFVTAAGNSGGNDDMTPFYPASYHLSNEIVVTAVNQAGSLPSFANYGVHSVSLAAPGVNIMSTVRGGYAYMSGTSMATPYVTGVVSLVAGLHPTYSAAQLVQQVLSTTKPLAGLVGKTATGGIVDAARALGLSSGRPGVSTALRIHATRASTTTLVRDTSTSPPHGPRRHIRVRHDVAQIASSPQPLRANLRGFGLPGHRLHAGLPNS